MKSNQLIGLMAVGIILPSAVIASSKGVIANEVRVKTNNIEAVTRRDGSIYINSGGNTVSVPRRRSYRSWNPFHNWNFPWHSFSSNRSGCRHSSYQSTQQTTRSRSRVIHNSSSSHICN
ncbi:MAG: hypothetical protein AAGF83_05620 [Cyanobacteria bacterium P01_G01_bin.67]